MPFGHDHRGHDADDEQVVGIGEEAHARATYFFAEFGPNTTTFVYPSEIFPVRIRTTCYGIAAAAGKIGGFIGTYALVALLPRIGLPDTSAIVAGVALIGVLVTLTMLPEPKGTSLEEFTERPASSGATLEVAANRRVASAPLLAHDLMANAWRPVASPGVSCLPAAQAAYPQGK